jgi:hypothetical protein
MPGTSAIGQCGDHRKQLLGMAPPDLAMLGGDDLPAFDQRD